MSKLNTLQFFEQTKKIVVAENDFLPSLNGCKLKGIVNSLNEKTGNVEIVANSGRVKINNEEENIISIDVQIPNSASLFVQLNGSNVTSDFYAIEYDKINCTVLITHNLKSRVIGFVYDENDRQAFYGIDYIDDNNVLIQFQKQTFPNSQNIWKVSLGVGGGLPITLSKETPNLESTDGTVPSSLSVYNFVKNEISVVNEDLTQFQNDVEQSFQIIDDNFSQVGKKLTSLEKQYIQQDENIRKQYVQADKVVSERLTDAINDFSKDIVEINNKLLQFDELLIQMSDLLDKINGTVKDEQ